MDWDDDLRWVTDPRGELARLEHEMERAKDPLREVREVQEAIANMNGLQADLRAARDFKSAADIAREAEDARRMWSAGEMLRDMEIRQLRSLTSAEDLLREIEDARRDMAEARRLSDTLPDYRDVLGDAERVRALASAKGLLDARTVAEFRRLLPRLADLSSAALVREDYDRVLADATRLAASADVRSLVERIEDPSALLEEALRYARTDAPAAEENATGEIELYGVSSEQMVALVLNPHPHLVRAALILYLALLVASGNPDLADKVQPIKEAFDNLLNIITLLAASKLAGDVMPKKAVDAGEAEGGSHPGDAGD